MWCFVLFVLLATSALNFQHINQWSCTGGPECFICGWASLSVLTLNYNTCILYATVGWSWNNYCLMINKKHLPPSVIFGVWSFFKTVSDFEQLLTEANLLSPSFQGALCACDDIVEEMRTARVAKTTLQLVSFPQITTRDHIVSYFCLAFFCLFSLLLMLFPLPE